VWYNVSREEVSQAKKIHLWRTEDVVDDPLMAALLPPIAIGLPFELFEKAKAEAERRGVTLSQVAAEYWARQVAEEFDK